MSSAADLLENRTLDGGWFVKKKIRKNRRNSQITGGNFSVGYEVEKEGKVAFLKALDFNKAFIGSSVDPATALQIMTSEFNFEKSILETCRDARIKKVVKLLDDGVARIENSEFPHQTQYLIFEWAKSDVRKETVNSRTVDHFLTLRFMHGITSGLYQLHQKRIIHQDIKPSNVLIFERDGDVKIGDFGRAYSSSHGDVEYNKDNNFPGDRNYAPPEILYEFAEGQSEATRKRADVYMLGSMLHFFFTQSPLTAKIIEKLPPQFGPSKKWTKEQIMPYLQVSYSEVVEEFKKYVQDNVREELAITLIQLTNLNPEKRGHPSAHRSHEDNLSLQRYVSIFDRLSRKIFFQTRKK